MAMISDLVARARSIIQQSDALLITAGAGMGVDSGLPDFRGDEGFWEAYPVAKRLGLRFVELASPEWFARDPELAWAFYGHRLHLYRQTVPHEGFGMLLELAHSKQDHFIFRAPLIIGRTHNITSFCPGKASLRRHSQSYVKKR